RLRVPSTKLVRGDLIALAEGERIPADGVLRQGDEVEVDESQLTGESVTVRKWPDLTSTVLPPPGGENTPFLYSGSLVVRGQGLAEVVATGPRSVLGQLGRTLGS